MDVEGLNKIIEQAADAPKNDGGWLTSCKLASHIEMVFGDDPDGKDDFAAWLACQLAAKDAENKLLRGLLKAATKENERLREAINRLVEVDIDADHFEGLRDDQMTRDAIVVRDAWREAKEAAKEKP